MKLSRSLRLPLAALLIFALVGIAAEEPDPGQIESSVANLLEKHHYSRRRIDAAMAKTILKNYLEALDYNHLYFTQRDVDSFSQKYGTTLHDDIILGNPDSAYKMFDVFKKRVEDRVGKVKEVLKDKFTFTTDRTIELNRSKAPWPKDETAADSLWRDRLEGEMLQESLAEHKTPPVDSGSPKHSDHVTDTPLTTVTRRYDQVLRNLHEQTKDDVIKIFLDTLAQTHDPHSEYMSRSEFENFSINMRLSLVGIGAVLRSDEGYARIQELVAGAPAARDGRLKVGDRVRAVAQGDKEFVEVVDMKLDKVVELIRGKKDSVVRLQVIPHGAADPSVRTVIEIKREEIKLKDQEARAEIIEHPMPDGSMQRLGWIILPSFYADMEHPGAANATSTTRDVLALLNRLKQEGISGLVMDLRRNGGGSLEEAVNLTGLFIKRGPVVQAKDNNGNVHTQRTKDSAVAYDGPMIVLTNRLSASASEIFAAALQDYNRAVIVGDQNTFGKGTVQTMMEIGRNSTVMGGTDAGALKLTIQKFYRIAGGSTQLRGVESDVKLPSMFDLAEIGESSLKGPLPYDTVEPCPFQKWDKPLYKADLIRRSSSRVVADPEFRWINEDLARSKQRLSENRISLNEKVRREELDAEKTRKEQRTAERAKLPVPAQKNYLITLENLSKPELQLAKAEKKPDGTAEKSDPDAEPVEAEMDDSETSKRPAIDPVRGETLNILSDLIDLSRVPPKTVSATPK